LRELGLCYENLFFLGILVYESIDNDRFIGK